MDAAGRDDGRAAGRARARAGGVSGAGGGQVVPLAFLGLARRCTASSKRSPRGSSGRSRARSSRAGSSTARSPRSSISSRCRTPRAGRTSAQLQGDMTYLGASLLPVTLAVGDGALLDGGADRRGASGRRDRALRRRDRRARRLPLDRRADGRRDEHPDARDPRVPRRRERPAAASSACCSAARCCVGAGGVFGAFLVIVGVLFAAGLFAVQVLLDRRARAADRRGPAADRALGDPRALASRARVGARAAWRSRSSRSAGRCCSRPPGALCLDATSFTGGAGGVCRVISRRRSRGSSRS